MTTKHVAGHFSQVFSEYGWPDTLLTDNGPCFTSQEFKKLILDMSVNHITSSPHYPQSNGLAEKYVQIVKNLFIKAHEEGTDYQKALMIYRNTPLDDNLLSPMQLLQGRAARSDLPMSHAAKVKYGLASGCSLPPPVPAQDKNERAPTHNCRGARNNKEFVPWCRRGLLAYVYNGVSLTRMSLCSALVAGKWLLYSMALWP